jgi:hypothetical protein
MEFSERFPLICDHHCACGSDGWNGTEALYLFGALTSAASFSNACWRVVAVDVEEFYHARG